MDDVETAKATLATARQIKDDDAVYRAPHLASMSYLMDDDAGAKKAKRRNQLLCSDSPSWLRPFAPSMAMRRNRLMCMVVVTMENRVRQPVAWQSVKWKRLASRTTT
jgi:hypothetical protein